MQYSRVTTRTGIHCDLSRKLTDVDARVLPMKNQDDPISQTASASADEPVTDKQAEALRRNLLKAGIGVSAVLISRQSHSTIGRQKYSCTVSGHNSGNQSHPDHDGKESCKVGHHPSKWCKFGDYTWPSSCQSPKIKARRTNGSGYRDHHCGDIPSKSKFSSKEHCISDKSKAVTGCRPGMTFKQAMEHSSADIPCVPDLYPGEVGRVASIWECLAYPESLPNGYFARCIAAAFLNARNWPDTYPCTEAQVKSMWVSIVTRGSYSAVPGMDWDESQVISFLETTWS